jgi:hypothetical protein
MCRSEDVVEPPNAAKPYGEGGVGEPVGLAISATREQYQGLFDRTG